MNKFLDTYKLSKLQEEEIENLRIQITSKEIESVIKISPNRGIWVAQSFKHLISG